MVGRINQYRDFNQALASPKGQHWIFGPIGGAKVAFMTQPVCWFVANVEAGGLSTAAMPYH
jgi:hypothetical protein